MQGFGAGALAFLVSLALPVRGAEYWVDQQHGQASDANAGTEDSPWQTVGKAAATLQPGDTVTVKPGIYRESVTPARAGAKGAPITYRAAGKGVVISGADRLTGWQRATPETCPGTPHHGNIWYADLDWAPPHIYVDGTRMTRARTPNRGWWTAQGGGTHTLVDAENLKPDVPWVGATVFFWDVDMTTQGWRRITAFDEATQTLTLDKPIYRDRVVEAGRDRYFVENKLVLIDRPGEWAVEPIRGGLRVYLWPPADGDPNTLLVEAPRRGRFLFGYGDRAFLHVQGFEVRHGVEHGIGSWTRGAGGLIIRDCYIHHNGGNGLYIRFAVDVVVYANLVSHNANGVTAGTTRKLVVQANEIAENEFDGLVVSHDSRNVVIRRNYIHGHSLWGHPDNIQFHNDVRSVVIEQNVILDAGQSLMMEKCEDGVMRDNMFVGAAAYAVIHGHGNVHRFRMERNTIALTGFGCATFTGTNCEVRDSVLFPAGRGATLAVANTKEFVSDGNVLWKPPGAGGCIAAFGRNWPATLEEWRKVSGQGAESMSVDPQFVRAPALCVQMDERRLAECTAKRLLVRAWPGAFRVGDHVEVKFDGVVRTVREAADDAIVIDPPLDDPPDKGGLVLNWLEETNYALDLRLKPDSPARGKGSSLDIQGFARGDVDGDGEIEVRRAE